MDDFNIFLGDATYNYPSSLGKVLYNRMKKRGTDTFQVCALSGDTDTFQEFLKRTVRTAICMRQKGLTKDDVVAVCDNDHFNTNVPYFAALFLCLVATALDPQLTVAEMKDAFSTIRAKIIFVGEEMESFVKIALEEASVETEIVVFGRSKYGNASFFDTYLKPSKKEKMFKPVEVKNSKTETAIVVFTCGVTGMPKAVRWSHWAVQTWIGDPDESNQSFRFTLMHFAPISWFPKLIDVMLSVFQTWKIVLVPHFNENSAWNWMADHSVHVITISVPHLIKMLSKMNEDCKARMDLRHINVYGGKLSEEHTNFVRRTFEAVSIVNMWSSVESVGGILTFNTRDTNELPIAILCRALGKPIMSVRYKVTNSKYGNGLGPYRLGELRFKSTIQMLGYCGKGPNEGLDKDGFVKTGDIVYYDNDHNFYFVERIDNIFRYRYQYIYPRIIEELLMLHPDVMEAVVVGIPHPEDGMRPAAVITSKSPELDAMEVLSFVEMFDIQLPLVAGVHIVDEVPATSSGIAKKRLIRDMLIQAFNPS